MILGITGHRPAKLGGYNNIKNKSGLIKAAMLGFFYEHNPNWIVSGMALGVDQWAVECAIGMDPKLNVKVIALIPCAGQSSIWPIESQKHYDLLLEQIALRSGKVVQLSEETYTKNLMHNRNKEIVNLADIMLAVWDGTTGGTSNCVWQAKSAHKPVYVLNPNTLEIHLHE